jgi:6-phosphogluconolactonase
MSVRVRSWSPNEWVVEAAAAIIEELPHEGSVVLTGGTAAERIYPVLADHGEDWGEIDIFFSDERCVPPDDGASNFGMAKRLLLEHIRPRSLHRMHGEAEPELAAADYDTVIRTGAPNGFTLTLLGLGADGHIAGLPPGTPALSSKAAAAWVYRTDGMKGITLTPRALMTSDRILVIVEGASKADAVRRFLRGEEPISQCPARLLLDHPNVTLLADTQATSRL